MSQLPGPIGIFDSGYGGITVFREIVKLLPQYDYIYLGDNARVPYGTRSFETVYKYTWECVTRLFEMNCNLVILACNTASAKALRTIQQNHISEMDTLKKVLGIIRPTAEAAGNLSKTGHIGIFATQGTVTSNSYELEICKIHPKVVVHQEACPMWVPLVENDEYDSAGADYFVKKNVDNLLSKSDKIDVILLACTHYPILLEKIRKYVPAHITILPQGNIVATSLADYLQRHSDVDALSTKGGQRKFYTTDSAESFDLKGSEFFGEKITSEQIAIP